MNHLAPVLLAAASVLASPTSSAAPAQGLCDFGLHIDVLGSVASVSQAPAAPLAGIAAGDTFEMRLNFAGDIGCTAAFGNVGYFADFGCCEMTVGGVTVSGDTAADPCIWGENLALTPPFITDSVKADAPFVDGEVRAVLELLDPNGLVGITIPGMVDETLFVPSVTAPGFAASLTLQNAAGAVLAVIDMAEISGTPGLSVNNYCSANPNSSGQPAYMAYQGSPSVPNNDFRLVVLQMPTDSFGLFLVSDTQGFVMNPGGSAGNLCVLGNIGRFVGPGQIQNSGSQDFISLVIDLSFIPTPTGPAQTMPGTTWNFTAWFRDVTPAGTATSNFADGLSLTFQ